MSCRKRNVVSVLAFVPMVLPMVFIASGTAHAQATTDAVYQDVRQIIEDLMTQEVSQTVAPRFACMSGRVPILATDPNFASDLTKVNIMPAGKPEQYVDLEAVRYYPRTLQGVYDDRFASLKPILSSEIAAFMGDLTFKSLRAAPPPPPEPGASAEAVKAFSERQNLEARMILLNRKKTPQALPTSGIDFSLLPEDQLDACSSNLANLLAAKSIGGGATALDTDCSQATGVDKYACDLAYAVQDTLEGDQTGAESYLTSALAQYVGELAVKTPTDAQVAAILPVLVTGLSASGLTSEAVKTMVSDLATVLNPAPKTLSDQLTPPLTLLFDQWKSLKLTGGKAISIGNWAAGVADVVAISCKAGSSALACSFFPRAKDGLGILSNLWPVIRLAAVGDDIDAAQLALSDLFVGLAKSCGTKTSSSCEQFRVYQAFADALVVYTVQARNDATPTDDARGALRTATENMIQQIGVNGGVDRPFGLKSVLLPDLALRYQWSGSYVNTNLGVTRAVTSVTWLKFRIPLFRNQLGYSAFTLSLIDLMAPLADIVGRSTTVTFNDSQKIWANLLAPHVDLEGGIPALSKHLLVGGGVAYRLVAPSQIQAATATTPAIYQYGSCSKHLYWANCFELGVFLKFAI